MTGETQPSSAEDNSQNSEAWSTAQLESALAHLERLQDQINHLRSAIPGLVKPLHSRKRSYSAINDSNGDTDGARMKASVFLGVKDAAERTAEDLRALGESWRAEETRKIFERARESEGRDEDLGRSVEVARWGWREKVEERTEGDGGES